MSIPFKTNDHFSNTIFSQSSIPLSNSIDDQQYLSTKLSNSDRRVSIKTIHQNEKPIQIGNTSIKPPFYNRNTTINPFNERDCVTVQRLSRSRISHETNAHSLDKSPINEEINSKK